MADGAHGLSSGLFYEEAYAAPADEVTELARVVARHGGVYATHLRSEMAAIIEAMHEAGDCAFEAGVPLVISHHKCAGPAQLGPHARDAAADRRARRSASRSRWTSTRTSPAPPCCAKTWSTA